MKRCFTVFSLGAVVLLGGCAGTRVKTNGMETSDGVCHVEPVATPAASPAPKPEPAPTKKPDPLAHHASAQIYKAVPTGTGLGEYLGRVEFNDTPQGLQIIVNLTNLPPGEHGFHVHEYPDVKTPGGHFDPEKTGRHLGPEGGGHKGDLPFITAGANGKVNQTFLVRGGVKSALFKNRAVLIRAGGDNYSDYPVPLGGNGATIAHGIVR